MRKASLLPLLQYLQPSILGCAKPMLLSVFFSCGKVEVKHRTFICLFRRKDKSSAVFFSSLFPSQILQGLVDVRIPHNDFYREGQWVHWNY